jgi:MFS family permease
VAAWEVGVVGSLFWSGMLLGSTSAPYLMFYGGARRVVALAAALTAAAALAFSQLPISVATPIWLSWGAVGAVIGAGTGLRWVANESWLYALLPPRQLGTLVGWHETLIHAMQAVGPLIIAAVGLTSTAGFYWAAGAALACFAALPFARLAMPPSALALRAVSPLAVLLNMLRSLRNTRRGAGARLGLWAGMMDGVLYGMFAVYCVQRGVSAQQAAVLMVVFGVGGLITSAPLGMLCDRKGVGFALKLMVAAGVVMAAVMQLPLNFAGGAPLWLAAAVLGTLSPLTLTMIVATQDASAGAQSSAQAGSNDFGQAISQVSLAFTMGTVAGPALAGWALDAGGSAAYAILLALLCLLGLCLNVRRPAAAA